MMYAIVVRRKGSALVVGEVHIGPSGQSSGGTNPLFRARRVKVGAGKKWRTREGAEKAANLIDDSSRRSGGLGDYGWRDYELTVVEVAHA